MHLVRDAVGRARPLGDAYPPVSLLVAIARELDAVVSARDAPEEIEKSHLRLLVE